MKPFIAFQHLVPQQTLSTLAGKLAASKNPLVKKAFTQTFAKAYSITLDEYARKKLSDFDSFNDFFTRELADNARPITADANSIACPADGAISQLGAIRENQIFQAKGLDYSLEKLLANDTDAKQFYNGQFATVYLAPSNYHRVHTPLAGTLTKTRYVPGQLFSVNTTTAENVPNLFARNERMVCLFDVDHNGSTHQVAVILVGAMIVAGIETVATGKVSHGKRIMEQTHNLALDKGAELGRFYLGSTAIVLLPESLKSAMSGNLEAGSVVQMGQKLGEIATA